MSQDKAEGRKAYLARGSMERGMELNRLILEGKVSVCLAVRWQMLLKESPVESCRDTLAIDGKKNRVTLATTIGMVIAGLIFPVLMYFRFMPAIVIMVPMLIIITLSFWFIHIMGQKEYCDFVVIEPAQAFMAWHDELRLGSAGFSIDGDAPINEIGRRINSCLKGMAMSILLCEERGFAVAIRRDFDAIASAVDEHRDLKVKFDQVYRAAVFLDLINPGVRYYFDAARDCLKQS